METQTIPTFVHERYLREDSGVTGTESFGVCMHGFMWVIIGFLVIDFELAGQDIKNNGDMRTCERGMRVRKLMVILDL